MLIYMPTLQLSIILNNIMDSDFQQIIQECNAFLVQLENNTTNSLMYTGKASDQIKKPFIRKLVQAQMDANQIFSLLSFEMYQEMLQRITKNIVEFIKQFIQKNKKEQLGKNPEIFFGINFNDVEITNRYKDFIKDKLCLRRTQYSRFIMQPIHCKKYNDDQKSSLLLYQQQLEINNKDLYKFKEENQALTHQLRQQTQLNKILQQQFDRNDIDVDFDKIWQDITEEKRKGQQLQFELQEDLDMNFIVLKKNEKFTREHFMNERKVLVKICLSVIKHLLQRSQSDIKKEQYEQYLENFEEITYMLHFWQFKYAQAFVNFNYQFQGTQDAINKQTSDLITKFRNVFNRIRQISFIKDQYIQKISATKLFSCYQNLIELASLINHGLKNSRTWQQLHRQILQRQNALMTSIYLQSQEKWNQI